MNDCKYPRKLANHDGDFLHNDDYEALIDSLLENNDLSIIPFTTLLQLNDLIAVYQSHCIRHREYSKAKKVYDLQTSITMEINKQTAMLIEYEKKAQITTQLATINSKYVFNYNLFSFLIIIKINNFRFFNESIIYNS